MKARHKWNLANYFFKFMIYSKSSIKFWFPSIPGEKLTKEEAKNLMKELCDPEDDEGFMPFMRKLCLIN